MPSKSHLIHFLAVLTLVFPAISFGDKTPSSNGRVLISRDAAVFRIDEKVVFFSELWQLLSSIQTFSCLKKNSLLLSALNLMERPLPRWNKDAATEINLTEEYPLLMKIVTLVKVQSFVAAQKMHVADHFKEWRASGCLAGVKDKNQVEWEKELLPLFKAESFLYERFGRTATGDPIAAENSTRSSIQLFFITLDKKFKHHVFF